MDSAEISPLHYASRLAQDLSSLVALWWAPSFRAEIIAASGQPLTVTEARLLWEVGRRGRVRPGELADLMELGAPAVTKVLARLRARELLDQEVDTDDRRVRWVQLTETGIRVTQRLFDVADDLVGGAVLGWEAEKTRLFADLLAEFLDAARHFPGPSDSTNGLAPAPDTR